VQQGADSKVSGADDMLAADSTHHDDGAADRTGTGGCSMTAVLRGLPAEVDMFDTMDAATVETSGTDKQNVRDMILVVARLDAQHLE
jgi:hypothetical protein